jgi:hypothetical protein
MCIFDRLAIACPIYPTPFLDRILPIIDRHLLIQFPAAPGPTQQNPNEVALCRIVPVKTTRSQRTITRVRLACMQAELAGGAE